MARDEKRRGGRDRDETPEFADRLVAINRVSKTVKGGKRFGFAALEEQFSLAVCHLSRPYFFLPSFWKIYSSL